MKLGFLKSVFTIAALLWVVCSGIASADDKVTDLNKLSVNGIKLGITSGEVKHVLGVPHKWAPPFIEFKATPMGRLTIETADDKAIWVRNGSKVEYEGRDILKSGAPVSALGQVIDASIKMVIRPTPDGKEYRYQQGNTVLVAVVQSNKIVGFVYGVKSPKGQ